MEEEFTLSTGEKIRIRQTDIKEARIFDCMLYGEPSEELSGFQYNWRVLVERKDNEH